MAGLLIKELIARGDLERCLIVCPGSLGEQWQDELYRRFQQNGKGAGLRGSGRARPASGTIFRFSASKTDLRSMHVTRLRAKNQLTLPASVVSAVGLKCSSYDLI